MRSIKPLPEAARSSVRSGIFLFDLTRVAEELVLNSLDAGATKVTVAIGVEICCIKVEDNGYGITRDGLLLLGERYATSKFNLFADKNSVTGSFGFLGEAVCSISDVSLLEIITLVQGMPNGYRKVVKGRKCLYLGIDDDRQDVGTTVTARDVFYNQPVRRKHLQSSPKRVLHSVKDCIFRIALVHPKISFKVIDMESGDDLLSSYPSSSPLALLTSACGIEASSSLHEFNISDTMFNLSGYLSTPSGTLTMKAFQHFYVNLRFISKGPIHKLLNQLSARFNSSDLVKGKPGSQVRKRSRPQTYPSYILNLSSPRAFYDLHIEPSRTSVEFKDWDRVLAFIEKVITCFWNRNISYDTVPDNSASCGSDMSREEDIWKDDDTISRSAEVFPEHCGISKKRCMKYSEALQGLLSPLPKMLKEEPHDLSSWSKRRFLCGMSPINSPLLKEQEKSVGRTCQTSCSFISHDESLAQYSTSLPHGNALSFEMKDDHLFSEDECSLNNNFYKDKIECFGLNGDVERIDKDVTIPFLRSCSSHASVSQDESYFASHGRSKFQAQGFIVKKKWPLIGDEFDFEEFNTVNQGVKKITQRYDGNTNCDTLTRDQIDSFSFKGKCFIEEIQPREVAEEQEFCPFRLSFNFFKDYYGTSPKIDSGCMGFLAADNSSPHATVTHCMSSSCVEEKKVMRNYTTCLDNAYICQRKSRRSRSAPPFCKAKKKFLALNSWPAIQKEKFHHDTIPTLQEVSCAGHMSSNEDLEIDSFYDARRDAKRTPDLRSYEMQEDKCDGENNFTSEEDPTLLDFGTKWRSSSSGNAIEEKLNNLECQESILDVSSGILHLSGVSLVPKSISRKCLEDAKVLQQVDRKFIPIVAGKTLALIDQHAADERIRLEELRQKVLSGEMKTIIYLDAEQELVLPEFGYQLLQNYADQIERWGWICNFHAWNSVSFKQNLNLLHNQPSVATLLAVTFKCHF